MNAIMVATDGSAAAEHALDLAIELAHDAGAVLLAARERLAAARARLSGASAGGEGRGRLRRSVGIRRLVGDGGEDRHQ
jgi:hypothetical protein